MRAKPTHTTFYRGKRVRVVLRSGEVVGKFVERRRRSIVLDCGEYPTKDLRSATIWRPARGEA